MTENLKPIKKINIKSIPYSDQRGDFERKLKPSLAYKMKYNIEALQIPPIKFWATEKGYKIILSILIFGIALNDLPYGAYQFARVLATVVFTVLAYKRFKTNNKIKGYFYFVLLILFQPVFKISLERELWILVDCIVGNILLWSALKQRSSREN